MVQTQRQGVALFGVSLSSFILFLRIRCQTGIEKVSRMEQIQLLLYHTKALIFDSILQLKGE